MPEGALLVETVESVLLDLAASGSTGCLLVRDQEGDEAEVYLRGGQVYAVSVPGRRVMLGVRLMSSGALTPEALAEALEIQRTELQGWRLGELLVHLGYVELAVVEEFVVEHLKDALADLLGWPVVAWKFRKNRKTRQDVAPPTPIAALLDDLRERATTWQTILAATGGPETVPTLDSGSPSDDVALGPNEWTLLCKVDGARSVGDLAGECGFTLFEAGQVVMRLVGAGLVAVPGEATSGAPDDSAPAAEDTGLDDGAEDTGLDDGDLEIIDETVEPLDADADEDQRTSPLLDAGADEDQRTSPLLVADLELVIEPDDNVIELVLPVVSLAEAEEQARLEAEAEEQAREDERRRLAAEAQRLAEAETLHQELEALAAKEAAAREARAEARRVARAEEEARAKEADQQARREQEAAERASAEESAWLEHASWLADARAAAEEPAWTEHRAWLAEERAAVEEAAWADHHAWLAQARADAEPDAWEDHHSWLAAERAGVEALAWSEHEEWLAAERASVEAAAWDDHAGWLLAERAAVEATAWVEYEAWCVQRAAEAAEQARLEQEAEERAAAAAAAEQARLDHEAAERAAAEAAAEQARLEHEVAEQARLEQEAEAKLLAARQRAQRELAAEVERRAQEAAEARSRAEADHAAREETKRAELAEAQRLATEAAEAIAAEAATRIAAEQELEAMGAAAEQALEAKKAANSADDDEAPAQRGEASPTVPAPSRPGDDRVDTPAATASLSLFTELNRDQPNDTSYSKDAADDEGTETVEPVAEVDDLPEPVDEREMTDTAMLLRELSSLGFSGDDQPAPPTAPAPRPVSSPSNGGDKKKRKGLFGRG